MSNIHLPVIGRGFGDKDRVRLAQTFDRLKAHASGDVCIAGGVAMQAHLVHYNNEPVELRACNDLDLIIHDVSQMAPTVVTDFALWHWHPHDPVDGLYMALVDRQNGVKIDIFGWERFPPRLQPAIFGKQIVYIRSAADLLSILIQAMKQRIASGRPLIRKQLEDAQILSRVLRAPRAELNSIEQYARKHPHQLQAVPMAKVAIVPCSKCVLDAAYPLTSEEEVQALRSLDQK